jgi:hypothetical protein
MKKYSPGKSEVYLLDNECEDTIQIHEDKNKHKNEAMKEL